VALARALINEPKVLLLDEPLGALDLKLREQMQEELKALQKELRITFVFVTHDQGEALSMADRVAIFNEGRIVQVGTPSDVYEHPRSRFVADFVGSSNVLAPHFSKAHGGPEAWISLRPEKIAIQKAGSKVAKGHGSADAEVTAVHYQGAMMRIVALADDTRLAATVPAEAASGLSPGDRVRLIWPLAGLTAMETGQ